MSRVIIADPLPDERSAFRLLLMDLKMELVGEASNWSTLITIASLTHPDMILLTWEMLPQDYEFAICNLRKDNPDARIIAIVSRAMDYRDELQSTRVDAFISKEDLPLKVAEILRMAV